MISTITGTVTTTVSPGTGSYASALTIAKTGAIESQPDAILATEFAVNVTNLGSISGEVSFYADDALTNAGQITGTTAVSFVFSNAAINTGRIIGGHIGIDLGRTSRVSNAGLIQGGYAGISALYGGYVLNTGTILQTGAGAAFVHDGVDFVGGTLDNTGTISGFYGALIDGTSLTNSGGIHGVEVGLIGTGIDLISNAGNINGSFTGLNLSGGTLTNTGTINDILTGVDAGGSETIFNSGSIYGGDTGIGLGSGGEVTNAGSISSGDFAVLDSSASLALTLIVEAGANFTGLVEDESKHGTLILAGAGTGILNMGTSFSGFSQIDFDPGTKWTLEGGALDIAGSETISGFGSGETIVLEGFTTTSDSFVSGSGLVLSNKSSRETLDITGNFSTRTFAVQNISGNTVIATAPCFCAGTRIATVRGNVPVECLKIGELVKTATGEMQPIRWIGTRSYDGRFIAGNHMALPVCIRRHALGRNVPSRDLYVSPDHSLCEGGVLVYAWRFVNGVSITQAESVEHVDYFHIELDRHAVIFANNTPVESFLDAECRERFQAAQGTPGQAPQASCLPRVRDGYYLARLKARIDARAGIAAPAAAPGCLRGHIDEAGPRLRGWAQDEAAPEVPVELELLCGGQMVTRFLANRYREDLRAAGLGSGCHAFELALPGLNGPLTVRRVSDGAVPGVPQAARRAG
jgi:hypothetical protein